VIDRRAVEEGVGQLRPDARADGRYGEAVRVPESLLPHLRRSRDLVDRCYAEPLDLDGLAAAAHISKFHFVRCFTEVYGTTPAAYVAERRIERAQDLLRATNLTVTEVCMLVGYSSLGSFSTKFRQLVGVSPSTYQGSFAATGAPHIPGCYVFMLGLHDRAPGPSDESARTEKRRFAGQS
jgi:AraC-like DNA-binding protein